MVITCNYIIRKLCDKESLKPIDSKFLEVFPIYIINELFYNIFNSTLPNELKLQSLKMLANNRFDQVDGFIRANEINCDEKTFLESFSSKTKAILSRFFVEYICDDTKSIVPSSVQGEYNNIAFFSRENEYYENQYYKYKSWSLLDELWPEDEKSQSRILNYFEKSILSLFKLDDPHLNLPLCGLHVCWSHLSSQVQNKFLTIIKKHIATSITVANFLYNILWSQLSNEHKSDFEESILRMSEVEVINRYKQLKTIVYFNKLEFFPFTSQHIDYIIDDLKKSIGKHQARSVIVQKLLSINQLTKITNFVIHQGSEKQKIKVISCLNLLINKNTKYDVESEEGLREQQIINLINRLRDSCPSLIDYTIMSYQQILDEINKEDNHLDHLIAVNNKSGTFEDLLNHLSFDNIPHFQIENISKALGRLWDSNVFTENQKYTILATLTAGCSSGNDLLKRGAYLEVLLRLEPVMENGRAKLIEDLIRSSAISVDSADLLINLMKYGRQHEQIYWASLINHRITHDKALPVETSRAFIMINAKDQANSSMLTEVSQHLAPTGVLQIIGKYM